MTSTIEGAGYLNDVLYRMCRRNPQHSDVDVVNGKIMLIGRAYSAALERKALAKNITTQKFYEGTVGPTVVKSDIDVWMAVMKNIKRVEWANIEDVLMVHKKMTALFMRITRNKNYEAGLAKRSLASKYLHFHFPQAFFIYDQIANRNLRNRLRQHFHTHLDDGGTLRQQLASVRKSFPDTVADPQYRDFVVRCLMFRGLFNKMASCRGIDITLSGYTVPSLN